MKHLQITIFFLLISLLAQSSVFFNVKEYGATGNKNDYATSAIQTAIDSCASNGGGTVYFPAGDYLSARINLKDNIRLLLDAGATLWASGKEEDYESENYIDNTVGAKSGVLISAVNLKNISISGKGTIQGQPNHIWAPLKKIDPFIEWEQNNAKNHGLAMERAYCLPPHISMIYILNCENVHINDISVLNSPNWGIHIQWSRRIFVSDLYIESDSKFGVNSDGLDIDGCQNVVVNNCIIYTGDDAICLKSTNKSGKYMDCENIAVNNCIVQSSSAGIKIGTETYGNFKNIQFTNCIVKKANRGLGIIVRDGGTVEDVLFSNITIQGQRHPIEWWGDGEAFRMVVLKRNNDSRIGRIKNVRFEHITAYIEGYNRVEGLYEQEIENIVFSNIHLFMNPESEPDKRTDNAIIIRKAQNIELDNVTVSWNTVRSEPDWKSALFMEDVYHSQIKEFQARQGLVGSQYPAIELLNCKDILLHHCIADEFTETFVNVSGSDTKKIALWNNYLKEAKVNYHSNNDVDDKEISLYRDY